MFSGIARSAEAMLSGLAKSAELKLFKFFLKKKLGKYILGEIDFDTLDVQLSDFRVELRDLALDVDYINSKLGPAAVLAVKEGSIGSLSIRLPSMGRALQIEINELELVLSPFVRKIGEASVHTSASVDDGNNLTSRSLRTVDHESGMVDSSQTTGSLDVLEGVKSIANTVKSILSNFHVKINKLIIAVDPSLGEKKEEHCRTLILRCSQLECGTSMAEDLDTNCEKAVDNLLGFSQLTNFVKFDGAVLEFCQIDGNNSQSQISYDSRSVCYPSHATTSVISGEKDGVSGTIKLSIPWKNGSLDIRKVNADVVVDPLELKFQPSSIKCFLYLYDTFMEMGEKHTSVMQNKVMESVYFSVPSHAHSSTTCFDELSTDKELKNHDKNTVDPYTSLGKDSVNDILLRGSHLISDWITKPISGNHTVRNEEPDFSASVDQFFECFDGLRNSQSALGSSGMWNWTCSVFSAITAASNLASGSLHVPSEHKHVETNLKARIARFSILFSFVDDDKKVSCDTKDDQTNGAPYVHYIRAELQELQLVLQVCPRDLSFEATVNHIEVADHFRNGYNDKDVEARGLLIRNMQDAVQASCPPLSSSFKGFPPVVSDSCVRYCRGVYRHDVVKVMLLSTSGVSQGKFTVTSVSMDDSLKEKTSFSLKLPPLVFWLNLNLISTVLDLIKEIGKSFESKGRVSFQVGDRDTSCPQDTTVSRKEIIRGNIFLFDARIILCFPCEKSELGRSYSSCNQFICVDISSPLGFTEEKVQPDIMRAVASSKEMYPVDLSCSVYLNVGNIDIYAVALDSEQYRKHKSHQKIISVTNSRGRPPVFGILWQDSSITGPWIVKRAKILATSDGMSNRNKFMGKDSEFASVTTIKDMEEFNLQSRNDIIASSGLFLHAYLSHISVALDSSQYRSLFYMLHEVASCLSCLSSDSVVSTERSVASQTSILVESKSVEISIAVEAVEAVKGSIQNELPGSWHSLKLKVKNFELLTVANIGGMSGANFLWVSHGEGNLWGSITGAPGKEFLLISCNNFNRGRGDGQGSNVLSSRFSGSDIIHLFDRDNFQSHLSINVRCGTIVAVGGRLDWFDTLLSFFNVSSLETDQAGDEKIMLETSCGSSFVLNLVDIGLSYEPYIENETFRNCSQSEATSGKKREQCVAGLLAASSLKLSNVMMAGAVEKEYNIKVQDLGLLLHMVSRMKSVNGLYSARHLRQTGYVKVAGEAHGEALLRINCRNGHIWDLECSESNIVLDTCHDTTSGLICLADQLQQIYSPDVEESIVHLQNRWDNVQLAQQRTSSSFSAASGSDPKEPAVVNLMDEICEGAFCLDVPSNGKSGKVEPSSPKEDLLFSDTSIEVDTFLPHEMSFPGTVSGMGYGNDQSSSSQATCPEIIDGYFLPDLRPLSELSLNYQLFHESLNCKSRNVKDGVVRGVNCGWYGDSSLRILEDHVLQLGEDISSDQLIEQKDSGIHNGDSMNIKACVLFKNINVSWRIYSGSDWQYIQKNVQQSGFHGRDTTVCLELVLSTMDVQYDIFPDGEISASRLSLSIQDFALNDYSKDAPWKQVLGYYQSKDNPRESSLKALKLDLEAVRPNPSIPLEESRLRISFPPLKLHLHQRQLDFLSSFFGGKSTSIDPSSSFVDLGESTMSGSNMANTGSHYIPEEALLPYFQKFDIRPTLIRVDYRPSRVDLVALSRGKYVELVNLVPWKGVELQLKHIQATGVYGWNCVCETAIGEWLEDISQNQIHKLLKGLPPIRSLVAVSSGASKLVSLPVKNYKKDQRILKGMQRGTIAFLRSISLEAIGLGVHLAAEAHEILLQAEYILTRMPSPPVPRPIRSRINTNVRFNQPKDARQGIKQAFESITDGFGKSASALVQTPMKKYQRGASVGSALATAVQAAPAAAIAPASAAARAMHFALLGVRNSLDPEHKKESINKYLGTIQTEPL